MSRVNGVTAHKQFNHRGLQHEISVYQADHLHVEMFILPWTL
jgi:hypothetical protein